MKKNYKKNILSKVLILGVITTPILIGSTLINNTSNIPSSKSTLKIINKTIPTVPEDGIITAAFVNELITYKKSTLAPGDIWDGILIADDFIGATSAGKNAFSENSEVTSITLPDKVSKIESLAFARASNLTNISALGATSIGSQAFFDTKKMSNKGIKLTASDNITVDQAATWGTTPNKLDIIPAVILPPKIPQDGIIDEEFLKELLIYKKYIAVDTSTPWNGSLLESDFTNATSVENYSFSTLFDRGEITSITLPESVSLIGKGCFSYLENLTTISALGATSIGADAFSGLINMSDSGIKLRYSTNIKKPNADIWKIEVNKLDIINTPIKPLINEGIITFEFVNELIVYKNSLLSTPNINMELSGDDFNGATSVAAGAFQNNIKDNKISILSLPIEVISIGANAFNGASSLNYIYAKGATSIGAGAFAGTTGIYKQGIKLTESANINVAQAGVWGTEADRLSITTGLKPPTIPTDGIITKDFVNELISYKKWSLSTISHPWDGILIEDDFIGTNSVAAGAFQNRNEITSITLPPTVLTIGANAFNGASALTTISALGATSIGTNAFARTNKMSNGGIKLTESANINVDQAGVWGTKAENLDIKPGVITPPKVPQDGIITTAFVTELITYKKDIITNWDGSIIETDLVNANSVAAGAFQNNTEITSITLPTSVLTIGDNAFSQASNLTTISALGATSIGTNAFAGANAIISSGIKLTGSTNINVDQAVTWGTTPDKLDITPAVITPPKVPQDGTITAAFVTELITYKKDIITNWDGSILETDLVNANSVADGAFQSNTEIKSITLPTSVLTIDDNAFNGASALTTISALGATSIGTNAFVGMTNMSIGGIKLTESANINVDQAVTWGIEPDKLDITPAVVTPPTVPIDGAITTAFVTELITYKKDKITNWDGSLLESDFTTATSVADAAFQTNNEIKSITLPSTVLTIGDNTFNGAINLTTISALGATSIGTNAFFGMTNMPIGGIKLTESANINVAQADRWGIESDKLNIVPEIIPPNPDPDKPGGFFDDTNNIYIVAGAGAGLLLLIVGIVTGVIVHRKNANGSNSEEKEAKLKIKDEAKDEAIKRLKIEQRLKDAKKNK